MDWFEWIRSVIVFSIPFAMGVLLGAGIFSPPEELLCGAEDCKNNFCRKCKIHKGKDFPFINSGGTCTEYKPFENKT